MFHKSLSSSGTGYYHANKSCISSKENKSVSKVSSAIPSYMSCLSDISSSLMSNVPLRRLAIKMNVSSTKDGKRAVQLPDPPRSDVRTGWKEK